MDPVLHQKMTQIILRQKELESEIKDLDGRLAKVKPVLDEALKILEEAKRRHGTVLQSYEGLQAERSKRLAESEALEMEKGMLRREQRMAEAAKPAGGTENLLDQLKGVGADPDDYKVDKAAKDAGAAEALAALKKKMGK